MVKFSIYLNRRIFVMSRLSLLQKLISKKNYKHVRVISSNKTSVVTLIPHTSYLTLTTLWTNSADNTLIFFLFFPEKNMTQIETICTKCQIVFSGKYKKNNLKCCLLKFLASLLRVKKNYCTEWHLHDALFPNNRSSVYLIRLTLSSTKHISYKWNSVRNDAGIFILL